MWNDVGNDALDSWECKRYRSAVDPLDHGQLPDLSNTG
jgi:hypothetical protein